VGASNVDARQLEEALETSDRLGLTRFEWVQNEFNLLRRNPEDDVLPVCEREQLGFPPFRPLAGGWLTGKYRRNGGYPAGSRMTLRPDPYRDLETDATFAAIEAVTPAAAGHGGQPAMVGGGCVRAAPG